jgi:hypothetical protein
VVISGIFQVYLYAKVGHPAAAVISRHKKPANVSRRHSCARNLDIFGQTKQVYVTKLIICCTVFRDLEVPGWLTRTFDSIFAERNASCRAKNRVRPKRSSAKNYEILSPFVSAILGGRTVGVQYLAF